MTGRESEGPGTSLPGPSAFPGGNPGARLSGLVLLALQEVPPHQVREQLESPFPPWAAPLSRFLFTVPQWVMFGGIILAAIVFLTLAFLGWSRRRRIAGWWSATSHAFRVGLLAALGVLAIVGAGLGWETWDFMQHDNDFCQSCHVMDVPFDKFTSSEHSELGCHACHQQPISASIRQVYLWVLKRPQEIGEHAPVPNEVCAECHIQQQPDSVWQRIVATAGHRVHLESDSLGDVLCVDCHGIEVHRFVPVDQTCGQSGCHAPDKTQIVLGSMAGQSDLHCVACHEFTAPVLESVALDTARAALVPRQEQCFSCHAMQDQLVTFDPELEPHGAVCGTCHNPHTQETPENAEESCATGACHAMADTLTPFHRGLGDAVAADCLGCHRAHTFAVEGEDCAACHGDVPGAGRARAAATPSTGGVPIVPVSLYFELRRTGGGAAQAQVQQRFEHAAHVGIACTDCHSFETRHGEITARTERDCMECHHTAPVVDRGCATCHAQAGTVDRRVRLAMRLGVWPAPRTREVTFDHDEHAAVDCAACHTDGITRRVTRTCETCHTEHHVATADCTRCHEQPPDGAHTIAVHGQSCAGSGCHEDAPVPPSASTRSFCLSCHQDLRDHRPEGSCAACHRVPGAGGAR